MQEKIGYRRETGVEFFVLTFVLTGLPVPMENTTQASNGGKELSPDITMIIERAKQHYVSVHDCEPLHWESIFDEEPPSDLWAPAVLSCQLLTM